MFHVGKTPFTYKGCYNDRRIRAMSKYMKKGNGNAANCFKAITAKGYKAFGIQYGGECWSGPNAHSTYAKYGSSPKCKNHKGGTWANDVFLVTGMYVPEVMA